MLIEHLATPVDFLSLHTANRQQLPFLLMSTGNKGWDMLLMAESTTLYDSDGGEAFIEALRSLPIRNIHNPQHLPFTGGWFVYMGYDLLSEFEPSVPSAAADSFPLAALSRVPAAILFDRSTSTTYLVAETAVAMIQLQQLLGASATFQPQPIKLQSLDEDDPTWYTQAVTKLKDYIYEGDVFQVNISRGWKATLEEGITAQDVFAALRKANPAPFSALADFGDCQVVSSSPERLVRVRDGWVDTRPIAGTHPRSTDEQEDLALKQRLIGSIKERAEHVMLIDLERNDLGRISLPGTVQVNELMAVESYAYVHHIESNIRGRIRPDVTVHDVFRAVFPGGTITGCPKVRTMQIIRELENAPRRAYTGSLGYINHDGTMDCNILIRTFMQQGNQLRFRAGGGIVADSDPERELMETRHKARGLLRALGVQ